MDCHGEFQEHVKELRIKAIKRPTIISKVASTIWGMESRTLAVTAHALLESIVNYGLPVEGI